ncbi:hypothetical protein MTR67_035060 [Solanum verrucosum]|uniref:Uncharacterized protein n=1 Tax=Solanum verrucosum TaxID=315347 RepID=A0AAF0ZL48_SOLVR|nr:hypothetical protein MTR67_035060 [Solanum verrucosum]
MHSPKTTHMEAAIRVVKYIKHAPGLGILMSAEKGAQLKVFCDADWGRVNSRSITGYLVQYGTSPISWKSKKQVTVSRSSAEVEYRAMASPTAGVVWLTGLLQELGVELATPVPLFTDSKSALQIVANPVKY